MTAVVPGSEGHRGPLEILPTKPGKAGLSFSKSETSSHGTEMVLYLKITESNWKCLGVLFHLILHLSRGWLFLDCYELAVIIEPQNNYYSHTKGMTVTVSSLTLNFRRT